MHANGCAYGFANVQYSKGSAPEGWSEQLTSKGHLHMVGSKGCEKREYLLAGSKTIPPITTVDFKKDFPQKRTIQ